MPSTFNSFLAHVLRMDADLHYDMKIHLKKAGADFVKTSTGFSSGGATVKDVALMRRVVGPNRGVKASGGIKDFATASAMIAAGANRIGAGAEVAIIRSAATRIDH